MDIVVRLGRDYYVRVAGKDYSVDQSVIGRFVDIVCGMTTVSVAWGGAPDLRMLAAGTSYTPSPTRYWCGFAVSVVAQCVEQK